MSSLVLRVAARYQTRSFAVWRIAMRYLHAKLNPQVFFDQKREVFKRILKVKVKEPRDVVYQIQDKIIPLLKWILTDADQQGVHSQAETSLKDRVEMKIAQFDKLAEGYQALERVFRAAFPYPRKTLEDEVLMHVGFVLKGLFEKKFKTMASALSEVWSIALPGPEELARAALKKASPEELAALERERAEDWSGSVLQTVHGFYGRTVEGAPARKLIQKSKVTIDWLHWFDFTQEVLENVYSEGEMGKDITGFEQFSIGRAKFIIADPTSSGSENTAYFKYLTKAHALIKQKGFEKLWYGIWFITSKQSRRLTPEQQRRYKELGYEDLEATAGSFHSGVDVIEITAEPNERLVKTIVHELGHRYWFKFMKPAQRARYNGYIRTNPSERTRDFPSGPMEDGVEKPLPALSDYGKSSIEEAFAVAFAFYVLEEDMDREQLRVFRSVLAANAFGEGSLHHTYGGGSPHPL